MKCVRMLRLDVREERHVAGALYGFRDLALLVGRNARALLAQNLGVWVGELFQIRDILVVDVLLNLYFFSFRLICHKNSWLGARL